jgi:hypothetical protein
VRKQWDGKHVRKKIFFIVGRWMENEKKRSSPREEERKKQQINLSSMGEVNET